MQPNCLKAVDVTSGALELELRVWGFLTPYGRTIRHDDFACVLAFLVQKQPAVVDDRDLFRPGLERRSKDKKLKALYKSSIQGFSG